MFVSAKIDLHNEEINAFLDGEKEENALCGDDVEGYLVCYALDDKGGYVIKDGELQTITKLGKVEFRWKKDGSIYKGE